MTAREYIAVGLVLIVMTPVIGGGASVATAFTFQGKLADGGVPVDGIRDFRVALFDADYGGNQVGDLVFVEDAAVAAGLVTLRLDFGPVFDGTALWLELSVRDGASTGTYTLLAPRQELTPAPFAGHAAEATHAAAADAATYADSAGDAAELGGEAPSYYLSWSNIDVPPDIADGDDDVLGGLECGTAEVAKWTGSAWSCSPEGSGYRSTFVVGPVGTAVENGAALRAALAAVPTPTSAADAALLKVEPGSYDLGSSTLVMKPWVDLEGSGEATTGLTGNVCVGDGYGVVEVAANAELSQLSVENTCTGASSVAQVIIMSGADAVVRRVAVSMMGAMNMGGGIMVWGDRALLSEVTVDVQNPSFAVYGVQVTADEAHFERLAVKVAGGGDEVACAIDNPTGASLWLDHVTASSWNGLDNVAIRSLSGTNLQLTDVRAFALYGTENTSIEMVCDTDMLLFEDVWTWTMDGTAVEITAMDADVTMRVRRLEMAGWPEVGVKVTTGELHTAEILIDHGLIQGSTSTLDVSGPNLLVRVGGSQLAGGGTVLRAGATLVCGGVYDESYVFSASGCP